MDFQEYATAVEKLRIAYFSDATTVDAIKLANIALMSDLTINDGMLKAAALQADANSKTTDQNRPKNTFLHRLDVKFKLKLNVFESNSSIINFKLTLVSLRKQICYQVGHGFHEHFS